MWLYTPYLILKSVRHSLNEPPRHSLVLFSATRLAFCALGQLYEPFLISSVVIVIINFWDQAAEGPRRFLIEGMEFSAMFACSWKDLPKNRAEQMLRPLYVAILRICSGVGKFI